MPAPLHGQITVSGTAQPLSATPIGVAAFSIKAPLSNTASVMIGGPGVTTTTGHFLDPGDDYHYERSDLAGQQRYQLGPADLYVVGTSGDKVSWLGSPP